LDPPTGCRFVELDYDATTPAGTSLEVNVLDSKGRILHRRAQDGSRLNISVPIQMEFVFQTDRPDRTPLLDRYQLRFDRVK